MALFLTPTTPALIDKVLDDLEKIVAPEQRPALAIVRTPQKGRAVLFQPSSHPPAPARRVHDLIQGRPFDIVIFPVTAAYPLRSRGYCITSYAGVTLPPGDFDHPCGTSSASSGCAASIAVIYDVTACGDSGYWVCGDNLQKIEFPSHVALYHELAHGHAFALGNPTSEPDAQKEENVLRAQLGSGPLRHSLSHAGACGPVTGPCEDPPRPIPNRRARPARPMIHGSMAVTDIGFAPDDEYVVTRITVHNRSDGPLYAYATVRRIVYEPDARVLNLDLHDVKHPRDHLLHHLLLPRFVEIQSGEEGDIPVRIPATRTQRSQRLGEDGVLVLEEVDIRDAREVRVEVGYADTPFAYDPERGSIGEQLQAWTQTLARERFER